NMSPSRTLIVEPDDGRTLVLNALNAAKKSIELTIYELSDPQILAALKAAQKRKVAVRVLYNWYSFPPDMQQREILPAIQELKAAGIQCRPAPAKFEVTHEKAFVIDGSIGIVMTFNLTSESFSDTRDFGIVTTVQAEVAEIAAVFSADWSAKSIVPNVASMVWSPVNSRTKLTSLINGATKTLDIYCEEADDPGTLGAMVAAAKRGVRVRFIAAVLSGQGTANGNARGITYLNGGHVNAVCKSFPFVAQGVQHQMYIHAKMALADYQTPDAQAYLGSENFSCVSLDDNRECGIIVSEPEILERLQATYNADWAQPSVPVTPDGTPLRACLGNPAARTTARVKGRT
ncbi:MAG TPA: phospholipase D-like domain-containing protein, partial [Candidatus Limnocylindrales bacterium]|nr:phospholipase D-like domain-containing protein [Candidatus Limnocylindrales bacterium]